MVGDGGSDYKAAAATGAPFVGRTTPDNEAEWTRLGVVQVADMSGLQEQLSFVANTVDH